MRKGLNSVLLLIFSVALLAGCEGTTGTTKDDSSVTSSGSGSSYSDSATISAAGSGSAWAGHPLDDPNSLLTKRTVYFEFDESIILEQDRPILEAHAQYLSQNPSAAITLEGHTDERGTREYNLALGERRSITVRQYMSLLGGSGQQLRTLSYGEERPKHDNGLEETRRLNRRAALVVRLTR